MQREGCSQEPELFVAVGLQGCSIDSTQQRQQDADHAPEGDEDRLLGEAPKEGTQLSLPFLDDDDERMMMIIAHDKMILTGLRSFESVMPVMGDDKI
jgi:hypothetical protein